jgi:23S rRNA (uracil1939-C5)-methyltransferase
LEESGATVAPFCRHFGVCGGCHWQDLAYGEQLRWKGLQVEECLQHLARTSPWEIRPVQPSPQQQGYRNKMEYTFAPRPWLPPAEFLAAGASPGPGGALGLHVRRSFDKVFDLEECFLPSAVTVEIVREARAWCRGSGLPAYNTREHRGYWRFLVIREGRRTGQTLVHLMTTAQGDPAAAAALGGHLQERFPWITTCVHSLSQKKAQVASGEASRNLWGPGYIEEQVLGRHFRISPQSFFQTNTEAAEGLYAEVIRQGEFTGREVVWDLYCGTGSIALCLAAQVERVVGFELVEDAVKDAYSNAQLNGVDNCQFFAGDLKELLAGTQAGRRFRPDVVITDPPRAGMHAQVVQALRELAPPRLIMVSCNPATLARDLALLQPEYEVRQLQPFDLFPHTPHIECVVCLERRQLVSS